MNHEYYCLLPRPDLQFVVITVFALHYQKKAFTNGKHKMVDIHNVHKIVPQKDVQYEKNKTLTYFFGY